VLFRMLYAQMLRFYESSFLLVILSVMFQLSRLNMSSFLNIIGVFVVFLQIFLLVFYVYGPSFIAINNIPTDRDQIRRNLT
jgi:hypothetical protein